MTFQTIFSFKGNKFKHTREQINNFLLKRFLEEVYSQKWRVDHNKATLFWVLKEMKIIIKAVASKGRKTLKGNVLPRLKESEPSLATVTRNNFLLASTIL